MLLTRYCRTKPLLLGIYVCAFVTNVCFAGKVLLSPRGVDNYHAAVYGDDGFGGQGLRGAVELQRLMPRDALPVLRLSTTAARKTSLFKRALLGPRDSDDDNICDSRDCSLTTQTCCGDGCMPIGAECCSSSNRDDDDDDDDDDGDDDDDDLYCEQGSRCGIFNDEVKCCRDSTCSSEKEAGKEVKSRATTRLSIQASGFTPTIITPTSPTVTSVLLVSVTPKESIIPLLSSSAFIAPPLVTSIVPSAVTSRTAITTTATATATATPIATSTGAVTGSISSSTGEGDAAAVAGAVATGLANRRVDSSWRVEGGMMLSLIGVSFYAFS